MNIKNIIAYTLYYSFGFYLPKTNARISLGSKTIRSVLAKGFVAHIGKGVNIQRKAIIVKKLSLDDYSGIGESSFIQGDVTIGKHVMMGPQVFIYTQNHQFASTDITMDRQGFGEEKGVVIKDDVWIGGRVTILPGVTVGTGAVIGAGAVVSHDVPDYALVVGNPARVVKYRNDMKDK